MNKRAYKYQKRFYYVIGSIPFIIVLLYFFSFKKTYEEYTKHQTLSSHIKNEGIKEKIILLRKKIKDNNQEITKKKNKTLLDIMTQYATGFHLKITDFAPPEENILENYQIMTQKITVKGTFHAILKTIYKLEEKEKLHISSIQFKSHYDRKKNEEYLLTTLYIQKIISNENN